MTFHDNGGIDPKHGKQQTVEETIQAVAKDRQGRKYPGGGPEPFNAHTQAPRRPLSAAEVVRQRIPKED